MFIESCFVPFVAPLGAICFRSAHKALLSERSTCEHSSSYKHAAPPEQRQVSQA